MALAVDNALEKSRNEPKSGRFGGGPPGGPTTSALWRVAELELSARNSPSRATAPGALALLVISARTQMGRRVDRCLVHSVGLFVHFHVHSKRANPTIRGIPGALPYIGSRIGPVHFDR